MLTEGRGGNLSFSFDDRHSEWVCIEHSGFAWEKAKKWWATRSQAMMPLSVDEAITLGEAGALAVPKKITVRSVSGEKFDRIIKYDLNNVPAWREPGEDVVGDVGEGEVALLENHNPARPWDDVPF